MNSKFTLIGTFWGMIDGRRIYRVRRGWYQVQHATRPGETEFDGTLRAVEKALGHKLVKMFHGRKLNP